MEQFNLEIQSAFLVYETKMQEIYEELHMLKESYDSNDYELLMEGFWDKVKAIAKAVGTNVGKAAGTTVNTVQKSVNYVHDLGTKVYDKGVELGKKAIDVSKELYNKVANAIRVSVDAIKKAPRLLWNNLVSLYTTISEEIGEIYEKAKEKGGEWLENAKKTAISIYNRMAQGLANTYISIKKWAQKNKEEFKASLAEKSTEMAEAANVAKQSSFNSIKKLGNWFSENASKFKDKSIDVAKYTGLVVLGLIALPFYAGYWALVKTHNLGQELLTAMQSGLATLRKNLGETYDILVNSTSEGYAMKRAEMKPTEPIAEEPVEQAEEPKKESYLITNFNNFKI